MKIESGIGNGKYAAVDISNRLAVAAETFPYQHVISKEDGQAYQVSGTTNLANGTVVAMHIKNTSVTRNLVATFIRHQIIDAANGTTFPNASCYFTLNVDSEYTSGGSIATPVNVSVGSGNSSETTAYVGNPTIVAGTEVDRWYTKAEGDMNAYNKFGSLIVQPGKSINLSYTGDHTAGIIYTRLSFVMERI